MDICFGGIGINGHVAFNEASDELGCGGISGTEDESASDFQRDERGKLHRRFERSVG